MSSQSSNAPTAEVASFVAADGFGLSAEKMRDLIDHLPVLIAYMDRNGVFRFSSRQHQRWWGRKEKDIIGHTHREVAGESNHLFAKAHLGRALSGVPVTFEGKAVYPTVGEKIVRVSYIPDFSADQEVQGVYVLVSDLTPLKEKEAELRRNEKERKTIFDAMPAFIWYKDRENRILRVNKAAADSMGLAVEQIEGRHTAELYPEHAKKYHIDDLEVINSGQPKLGIIEQITLVDGETRWIRTDKVPHFGDGGEVSGVIVFSIDITDRVKAEQDRSAIEQQLLQSQKMEALGTLAGGIAHDFNNVLAGILGYVGLAQLETSSGSAVGEYMKKIDESVHRAKDLVHQILAFSRHSSNNLTEDIDAKKLTIDALSLVKAGCGSHIEIVTQFSDGPLRISGSSAQLHQVLVNVFTNALYAMRDKPGTLRVQVDQSAELEIASCDPPIHFGVPYIRFSIQDSGTGMSEEVRKRIFEPYYTTKPMGEGSGLGLSVVHGIIRSMGGSLAVDSEVGKGTTFCIYLPAQQGERTELPAQIEPDPAHMTYQAGRGKVIFIDDEPVLEQLGRSSLTSLGYDVSTFRNAKDALEKIEEDPALWDLILTDQTMPGMSGDVFIRNAREMVPEIPIILCTGYGESLGEKRAIECGATAFLTKPYSLKKLAGLCAQLVRKRP